MLPRRAHRSYSCRRLAAAAACTCCWATQLHAVDRTWTAGTGTFQTATNWSGTTVPGAGDRAHFNSSFPVYGVTFAAAVTNGSLLIADSPNFNLAGTTYTLTNTGASSIVIDETTGISVTVGLGTLTSAGGMQIGPGGSSVGLFISNGATLSVASATMNGTGSLTAAGRFVVNTGSLVLASQAAGACGLVVPGTGSVSLNGGAIIGQAGSGSCILQGDLATTSLTLGSLDGSSGSFQQSNNAQTTMTGNLTVGASGIGIAELVNGTLDTSAGLLVGTAANGSGSIIVGGAAAARLTATSMTLGGAGRGDMVVRGASVVQFTSTTQMGSGVGGRGSLAFQDGAVGTFGGLTIGDAGSATLDLSGNASVTSSGSLNVANGVGSSGAVHLRGGSDLQLGVQSVRLGNIGNATLTISDGAKFASGAADLAFSTGSATVTVGGGDAQWTVLGALDLGNFQGGVAVVDINEGGTIGAGTVAINPGSVMRLNGGTLNADALVQGGAGGQFGRLDFNRGTIAFGFGSTVTLGGTGGFFPGVFVADTERNLRSIGTLNFSNGLTLRGGSVAAGTISINAGAEMNFADAGSQVTVSSLLSNNGIIRGDGRVSGSATNQAGGSVLVGSIDRIEVTGNAQNLGLISLAGGRFEGRQLLTNSAGGRILGRGTLQAGSISNAGSITLSAGLTDVLGDLTNLAGGKVIVTGAGNATFYDNVTNNAGSEFRVSNGATATFIDSVLGLSLFTGAGVKIFENGASGGPLVTSGASVVESTGSVSASVIREQSLSLLGGEAAISANGTDAATSRLTALTISGTTGAWDGRLDLADNALVVDYAAGSPLATLADQLRSGFASGAWNGQGIASSVAAVTPNRAVGIAEATDIGAPAAFAGQLIDATAVLVRFTLPGDANLDRRVDIDDFGLLASNFNTPSRWSRGDFNYSGTTDIDDFASLATNFNQALSAAGGESRGQVPEPTVALWLATSLLSRRRRPSATNQQM